ncbi:MAG: UDP-2,3-diacylglucosamine diphosphatase [Sodalis sp. (in: enterobacteria)]
MSTLFLADIHLCAKNPSITAGFLHFLHTRAITAKAIYILGDLFDVWIGDDDPNPLHHDITLAIQALGQRGIRFYFIHGNRDFLLGKRYAGNCGIALLPTQKIIKINGFRIVILHGDTLCTTDRNYQRFRFWMHQNWLQRLFLSLPLQMRLHIAHKMRINSLRANAEKLDNIMDVNPQAISALMEYTGATVMIHGHTHRPAIHFLPGNRCRVVLGAWHNHGSAIEISDRGIMLHEFPFCD